MDDLIKELRQELKTNIDPHTLSTGQNFFKEEVKLYGVKVALVTKLAKSFEERVRAKGKGGVFAACEALWRSGYLEESFVACHWSYAMREAYVAADLLVFERWLDQYVTNWASCDTLCNHTVGALLMRYPEQISHLLRWANAENRWMRRGAAVSLIIPARKGLFLDGVFAIADALLMDEDDLVQKGYGWMLKAAGEAHQAAVFDFVMDRKDVMPRTALRYAVEKMPDVMRKQAMSRG